MSYYRYLTKDDTLEFIREWSICVHLDVLFDQPDEPGKSNARIIMLVT